MNDRLITFINQEEILRNQNEKQALAFDGAKKVHAAEIRKLKNELLDAENK